MRGTGIEKEAEICAANITKKTIAGAPMQRNGGNF
jgi:hypothetical protein